MMPLDPLNFYLLWWLVMLAVGYRIAERRNTGK
jgi:hypothetical protein